MAQRGPSDGLDGEGHFATIHGHLEDDIVRQFTSERDHLFEHGRALAGVGFFTVESLNCRLSGAHVLHERVMTDSA